MRRFRYLEVIGLIWFLGKSLFGFYHGSGTLHSVYSFLGPFLGLL